MNFETFNADDTFDFATMLDEIESHLPADDSDDQDAEVLS